MTILPYGDCALLVNFEQIINSEVNQKVISLADAIEEANIKGVTFLTPAYCSLTIGFNPVETNYNSLRKEIEVLQPDVAKQPAESVIRIPVCYSEEFALDMATVVQETKLSWEEIIHIHTSSTYRVYMLGFLPGFVYLGSVPKEISIPRKQVPRVKVPALSVGLAGLQTGIYPSDAPGGWQIIGKTPIRVFDSRLSQPFLISPGMQIKFHSIQAKEYQRLSDEVQNQTFAIESLYE